MKLRTVFSYLPKNNGQLLEVGCSFGVLAFEVARRGYQVTGLDVNPASIDLANKINGILKLNNVRFSNMDFIDNRFPADEFDIVVAVEVLAYFKDDRRAIDEAYRVLKDGGVLIVSAPYAKVTEEYPTPVISCQDFEGKKVAVGVPGELYFRNGYNREGLVSLLNSSGFKVERCTYTKIS
jgi:SAM-dependent methyltransferase